MGDGAAPPLVSVCIPLYRSAPFLDTILQNLEAIEYPRVEILISDRHLFDDALEMLRRRFGSDPRFRFLQATDGLNWVEHFNLLLRESRGGYVLLMPHDDSYPSNYIRNLVEALDGRPDAVLAFGRVEQESLDGFLPTLPFSPPPIPPDVPWSFGTSLKLLTMWQLWFAFRGLIRREAVVPSGLYLRQTYQNIRADIYWVFALSLRGPLLYVPSCSCTKRFYRSSAGAGWRFDRRQALDAWSVLGSYLDDFAPSRRQAIVGRLVLFPWTVVQAVLPAGWARRFVAAYERLRVA